MSKIFFSLLGMLAALASQAQPEINPVQMVATVNQEWTVGASDDSIRFRLQFTPTTFSDLKLPKGKVYVIVSFNRQASGTAYVQYGASKQASALRGIPNGFVHEPSISVAGPGWGAAPNYAVRFDFDDTKLDWEDGGSGFNLNLPVKALQATAPGDSVEISCKIFVDNTISVKDEWGLPVTMRFRALPNQAEYIVKAVVKPAPAGNSRLAAPALQAGDAGDESVVKSVTAGPNPFESRLLINFENNVSNTGGSFKIVLADMHGKPVYTAAHKKQTGKNSIELNNLGYLLPGNYTLLVYDALNQVIVNRQLIKVRN